MNPKFPIRSLVLLVAGMSLVACRKSGTSDRIEGESSAGSAESTFVAPAEIERRFPGALEVLKRHAIPLVKVEVPQRPSNARFVIDLSANPKLKTWDPFVAFVLDFGENLEWRTNVDFEDRSKHVRVLLDYYAISTGQGGFVLVDSLEFFGHNQARFPEDPLDGINKTPREVGIDVVPNEDPDAHVEDRCTGMLESGSKLFYGIEREEFAGEDDPSGSSVHFGVGQDRYASADDGKEWKYALAFPGLPMRGEGKKARFLRWGSPADPKAWRMVGGQCASSPGLHLWRYRASVRRLVRISLDDLSLTDDVRLDSTALDGELQWVQEMPGMTGRAFALTKSDRGWRVYSSSDSGLFDRVWQVPEKPGENFPVRRRLALPVTQPESLFVGGQGFRLQDIEWKPATKTVPIQGS